MPELPDITVYVEGLRRLAGGATLEDLKILNPFVLRTVSPKAEDFAGRELEAVSRLGKRVVESVVAVLSEWTERLRAEVGDGFPEKVTAFREDMAVHGRFDRPCPDCGAPVQRIRYADLEANYCAGCQTGGRILADRSLSRLLKADWPKTLDDLERRSR